MDSREEQSSKNYRALKERLWNQPRSRQVLERLEQDRVPQTLLEAVAGKLAKGQHGEGEILATIYGELIRNRDRSAIIKQVVELRVIFARIHQDLLQVAAGIHQLFEWDSYQILEYQDWSEFAEKELGLSEKVAGLLLRITGQNTENTLDTLVQRLVKGYAEIPGSDHEPQSQAHRSEEHRKKTRPDEPRSS